MTLTPYWFRNRNNAQRFDAAVLFSGKTPAQVVAEGRTVLPLSHNGLPILNRLSNGKILTFYTGSWSSGRPLPMFLQDDSGRQYSRYEVFGF
jgi:hypothetical protein